MEMNIKRKNKGLELVEEDEYTEEGQFSRSTDNIFFTKETRPKKKELQVNYHVFKSFDEVPDIKSIKKASVRKIFAKTKLPEGVRTKQYRYTPKPWLARFYSVDKKGIDIKRLKSFRYRIELSKRAAKGFPELRKVGK